MGGKAQSSKWHPTWQGYIPLNLAKNPNLEQKIQVLEKAPVGKARNNYFLEQFPSQAEDTPFKRDPTRALVHFPGSRGLSNLGQREISEACHGLEPEQAQGHLFKVGGSHMWAALS